MAQITQYPKHVGIIPDGNRRWCGANGISYQTGYELSFEKCIDLCVYIMQLGCHEVSIYMCSRENLNRPEEELIMLYNSITATLPKIDERLSNFADILHVGSMNDLPKPITNAMNHHHIRHASDYKHISDKKNFRLNLLIHYSPIDEIEWAYQKHIDKKQDEGRFTTYLWVKNPVQLTIRTAGVSILSNFLPLQTAYSLIWTTSKFAPELTTDDAANAIEFFQEIGIKWGR